VRVEREVELTALSQDAGGVSCTLRRAGGGVEDLRVPWVLGCDGAHSAVRHQLGVDFAGEAEPNDWMLADVHVRGGLADDEVTIYFHEKGVLFFFPITPQRFRVVADLGLAPSLDHPPDPTLAEVQKLVDERGPRSLSQGSGVRGGGRGPHPQPGRGAGDEHGHPGCVQPRLEAGAGRARTRARAAARQL
jgi:2-polyprenyl-6-methoxyphenol hydroxylase-like FAD-dependent oxidoreductase